LRCRRSRSAEWNLPTEVHDALSLGTLRDVATVTGQDDPSGVELDTLDGRCAEVTGPTELDVLLLALRRRVAPLDPVQSALAGDVARVEGRGRCVGRQNDVGRRLARGRHCAIV